MRYRKKPVVIEALTWQEVLNEAYVPDLDGCVLRSFLFRGRRLTKSESDANCYLIPTLEGDMRITPDDMLIIGVAGEIYPCKKAIFDATYEPVPDPVTGEPPCGDDA